MPLLGGVTTVHCIGFRSDSGLISNENGQFIYRYWELELVLAVQYIY